MHKSQKLELISLTSEYLISVAIRLTNALHLPIAVIKPLPLTHANQPKQNLTQSLQ